MADLLESFLEFWVDVILLVPRMIYWAALEILNAALSVLPEFDPVDPASFSGAFTGDLVWFLTMFEVPAGLGIITSALVARFFLRRIPLIG